MKTFTAIIEKAEEGGYFAYCPEVQGANGQGKTIEECCEDLKLAIQLVLNTKSSCPAAGKSPVWGWDG